MKLQRSLYDIFHHRMDRKQAETQTIGEFHEYLRSRMSMLIIFNNVIIMVNEILPVQGPMCAMNTETG